MYQYICSIVNICNVFIICMYMWYILKYSDSYISCNVSYHVYDYLWCQILILCQTYVYQNQILQTKCRLNQHLLDITQVTVFDSPISGRNQLLIWQRGSQLDDVTVFVSFSIQYANLRHPNTSREGVIGMFWGSKYLLRRCLDVKNKK